MRDLRAGSPDGTDTITAVENFRFSDRTVATSLLTTAPVINLSTPSVTQDEGTGGSTSFTYTVSLSAAHAVDVTVQWSVVAGSASALDFVNGVLPFGTLTFAAGATTGTITVPVLADATREADETFQLVLANPSGGATLGAAATATGTIINDDFPIASVSFAAGAQSEAVTAFNFTVSLSEALLVGQTLTLDYAVSGTGTNPANAADFAGNTLPGGTVTFSAGQLTQTVTVVVANDSLTEPNETFLLTISNPTGTRVTLGTPSATATILNDDITIVGTNNGETLNGTATADRIEGLGGNDVLNGLGGNDSLYGGNGADTLRGNEGDDWLQGDAGNDSLYGGDGNDSLYGGTEADVLYGNAGNDLLYGGAGNDRFTFDSRVGVDRVMDFASGDLLVFSRAVFSGLGTSVSSNALRIVSGASADMVASTNNHRFIYNQTTGDLYYDADGARAGSDAVLVGVITTDGQTAATLSAASFATIA